MTNPLPPDDGRPSAQHPGLDELWSDPQLTAGLEDIAASLAKMAADKYKRLFPWEDLPDFDAFEAWLAQVGTTLAEFGFHTPDPQGLAQRIAAVGPVGGWRIRDEVSGQPRPATPDEVARLVAAAGLAPDPDTRPRVQRRKHRD